MEVDLRLLKDTWAPTWRWKMYSLKHRRDRCCKEATHWDGSATVGEVGHDEAGALGTRELLVMGL